MQRWAIRGQRCYRSGPLSDLLGYADGVGRALVFIPDPRWSLVDAGGGRWILSFNGDVVDLLDIGRVPLSEAESLIDQGPPVGVQTTRRP